MSQLSKSNNFPLHETSIVAAMTENKAFFQIWIWFWLACLLTACLNQFLTGIPYFLKMLKTIVCIAILFGFVVFLSW